MGLGQQGSQVGGRINLTRSSDLIAGSLQRRKAASKLWSDKCVPKNSSNLKYMIHNCHSNGRFGYKHYRKAKILKFYAQMFALFFLFLSPSYLSFAEFNGHDSWLNEVKRVLNVPEERGAVNMIVPFVDDLCDFVLGKILYITSQTEHFRYYRQEYKHDHPWSTNMMSVEDARSFDPMLQGDFKTSFLRAGLPRFVKSARPSAGNRWLGRECELTLNPRIKWYISMARSQTATAVPTSLLDESSLHEARSASRSQLQIGPSSTFGSLQKSRRV